MRLRAGLLQTLVADLDPDVLCLQETKVPDALFPHDALAALKLPYVLFRGMKGYNGVAILSRYPLAPIDAPPDWCGKGDCRHLTAIVDAPGGPVTVHNFYVPAGGDVPDRAINDKFGHKLDFVAEARAWFARQGRFARTVLVGDLNIAPLEHDVWGHKQMLGVVSHTPVETEALTSWLGTGFVDALRHFVPHDQKLYTWWSYRNRDWRASDRGRRLDHVWVTPDLVAALTSYRVHKDARDWKQASDHVPVLVELQAGA